MGSKRVLVCTPRVPEFDREGGSRRIFHFIQLFLRDGWSVTAAAVDGSGSRRYARTLQQMGVATYALAKPWSKEKQELIEFDRLIDAGAFDVILIAFWYCAEAYIPIIRSRCPSATVIIDSIDIHFLRQSRQVFSGDHAGEGGLDHVYGDNMRREINAYAAADAVLTVSDKEAQLVDDMTGRKLAYAIPDMEDIEVSPVPFADRRGILFVGNFRHPPNAQAVEYLCGKVLPKVPQSLLADHPVYIVGNDPTPAVIAACEAFENVRLVGWVPSVVPYLERVRISVIPLLHGAGTKRKLMQSAMAGTPSVSTSVGVEGLGLLHDVHVLVADDAALFASSIVRLIQDEELWQRLASQGREFIARIHGREAAYGRWASVMAVILKHGDVRAGSATTL